MVREQDGGVWMGDQSNGTSVLVVLVFGRAEATKESSIQRNRMVRRRMRRRAKKVATG